MSPVQLCDATLFNNGAAVARCTRRHGVEHSHSDHTAREYVGRGEAKWLGEHDWRCDGCGCRIEEAFTFPAPGSEFARDGDPEGDYCEGCYIDLRNQAAA